MSAVKLTKIFSPFFLTLFVFASGCGPSTVNLNNQEPGAEEGFDAIPTPTIESELLGVWTAVTMSVEGAEPFEVSLMTALRIESSLKKTSEDGDLSPLTFEILIDQLEITNDKITRTKIQRNHQNQEFTEIFSSAFTKAKNEIVLLEPEAPRIFVEALSQSSISVSFSSEQPQSKRTFRKDRSE